MGYNADMEINKKIGWKDKKSWQLEEKTAKISNQ